MKQNNIELLKGKKRERLYLNFIIHFNKCTNIHITHRLNGNAWYAINHNVLLSQNSDIPRIIRRPKKIRY